MIQLAFYRKSLDWNGIRESECVVEQQNEAQSYRLRRHRYSWLGSCPGITGTPALLRWVSWVVYRFAIAHARNAVTLPSWYPIAVERVASPKQGLVNAGLYPSHIFYWNKEIIGFANASLRAYPVLEGCECPISKRWRGRRGKRFGFYTHRRQKKRETLLCPHNHIIHSGFWFSV